MNPWVRTHGAHLRCRFPGIVFPTVVRGRHTFSYRLLPEGSGQPPEPAISRPLPHPPSPAGTAKAALRDGALKRRAALTPEERASADAAIGRLILGLDLPQETCVAAYLPIRGEVDLGPAIAGLCQRSCRIGLPVVIGEKLIFRSWQPGEPLERGAFGTMWPGEAAPTLTPDVFLLPMSAFDRRGGRIGYGRGYYDRAIADLHRTGRTPRLIGVAFSVQEVDSVPMERHDVPLDLVITERGVLRPVP